MPLACPIAALCDQLNQAQARYPGTELVLHYRSNPTLALHELTL